MDLVGGARFRLFVSDNRDEGQGAKGVGDRVEESLYAIP